MSRNKNGQFAAGAPSERRRDWIGERFGKLVVTQAKYGVKRGNKTRTICTCRCDCGNTIETVSDYLVAGKTSCGCDTKRKRTESQRIDLTGKKFGRLTVLEMLWVHPHTLCRCKCDCGNETVVRNAQLSNGKTTSCGCVQRERASKSNTKDFTGVSTRNGILFIRPYRHVNRVETGGGVWEWECECPACHKHFYGIPAELESDGQLSCGCLGTSTSRGERLIANELDYYNVPYKHNYMTKECTSINMLRFDFAIFDSEGNVRHIIEYDGKQHYEPVEYFGGESTLLAVQQRDKIKDAYCKSKNIPLTRMPYTMSDGEIKDTIKNIINP